MTEPAQEPRAFGRVSSLDYRAGWEETLPMVGRNTEAHWHSSQW